MREPILMHTRKSFKKLEGNLLCLFLGKRAIYGDTKIETTEREVLQGDVKVAIVVEPKITTNSAQQYQGVTSSSYQPNDRTKQRTY